MAPGVSTRTDSSRRRVFSLIVTHRSSVVQQVLFSTIGIAFLWKRTRPGTPEFSEREVLALVLHSQLYYQLSWKLSVPGRKLPTLNRALMEEGEPFFSLSAEGRTEKMWKRISAKLVGFFAFFVAMGFLLAHEAAALYEFCVL